MENGYKEALEQAERRRKRWFRTFVSLSIILFIGVGVCIYIISQGFMPAIVSLVLAIVALFFSIIEARSWSAHSNNEEAA